MRKILLALLLLIVIKGFSQTHTLDSLKKLIDNDEKEDSAKVNLTLYEYSRHLFEAAQSVSVNEITVNPFIMPVKTDNSPIKSTGPTSLQNVT